MNKLDTEKTVMLSDADWLKLRDFSKAMAARLKKRLPCDWYLPVEDVQSAVYGTFIKLFNSYRPGAMSVTSYCYQYAERWTYLTLMAEYRRLKNQDDLDAVYGEDFDDEPCRHRYGSAEVKALSVDEREK